MSITLVQAQAVLDALIQAQIDDPLGALGSVTIQGRTVSYKGADDLIKMVNYWSGIVADLRRKAARAQRHGRSVASFR